MLGQLFAKKLPVEPYYKYHVFFCTNQRENNQDCCQRFDALGMRQYAKAKIKQLGLSGKGGVRINTGGCLDRCELGPILVIYPDSVWYTYVDTADIDEIIQSHLIEGKPVTRLLPEF